VDYNPDGDGEATREWLRGIVTDLEADGLVEFDADSGVARLAR
jgi:A/G-specific adenine glycosylase